MGREKRECLKSPSNSHRLLFAIVVTIESEEGSFPIAQCQPVLFFPSQARRRVRFDGGILSTVVEQAESVRSCIDKLLQEKRGLTQVKKQELGL